MADKDFKIKNDFVVGGNQVLFGSVPLAFNSATNKFRVYIEEEWRDIVDTNDISALDFELTIGSNNTPNYIVNGGGESPESPFKYADNGDHSTSTFSMTFDAGSA